MFKLMSVMVAMAARLMQIAGLRARMLRLVVMMAEQEQRRQVRQVVRQAMR